MPTLAKWTPEEIAAMTAKKNGSNGNGARKAIEEAYDALLAELNAGDYATVTPDEGEDKVNVRNRIKSAAKRRGLSVVFLRTRDDLVKFHLEQAGDTKGD
jgi:hypothetical protein